jgi:hypothetical protein
MGSSLATRKRHASALVVVRGLLAGMWHCSLKDNADRGSPRRSTFFDIKNIPKFANDWQSRMGCAHTRA